MKYYRFIICFFDLWGTKNWYQEVDIPTLFQYLYHWRVSPLTAWKVAKTIWID